MAKQSSSIELKTFASTVDSSINCGKRAETDNSLHQCSKGINIKFKNLVFCARQNIIWDRCKLQKKSN